MVPFLILLTFPLLLYPFAKGTTINRVNLDHLPLSLFFLMLTILVMFRHQNVGNDTANYMKYFMRDAHTEWRYLVDRLPEIGYRIFSKVISLLSDNPHFFIAASGLAVTAMIYPTYRAFCVDPPLTIVLFCIMSTFPMMFSGIRQMLAIGVGMIAFSFVRRKKPISFLLTVAAAMSIHTSAFVLLIMYPLYHARITKKWAFFMIPGLAIAFVFNRQIFHVLGRILQSYTDYDVVETATGAYTMLLLFLAFAVFSFVISDESRMVDDTIGLRNFMLLALVLQMFVPLNYMAMRMNYYYIVFIPLLLPRVIACSRVRYRSIAAASRHIMVAFFFLYFFMNAKPGSCLHAIPYHFFWEYYR